MASWPHPWDKMVHTLTILSQRRNCGYWMQRSTIRLQSKTSKQMYDTVREMIIKLGTFCLFLSPVASYYVRRWWCNLPHCSWLKFGQTFVLLLCLSFPAVSTSRQKDKISKKLWKNYNILLFIVHTVKSTWNICQQFWEAYKALSRMSKVTSDFINKLWIYSILAM